METPSRHSFDLDGATRVFPVASPIKGDNYCRLEVDGVIINDRSKYDIVNNSVVFIDLADVPQGSQLDVLVVQSEEALGQLSIITNIDIVAQNINDINTVGSNIADVTNFADVYVGASATDPLTRYDGAPLQAGDLYFNTTVGEMRVYTGTLWNVVTSSQLAVDTITATGATDYLLSVAPNTSNNTDIFINGVYQEKSSYSVAGSTVTFTEAPLVGDTIEVIIKGSISVITTSGSETKTLSAGQTVVQFTNSLLVSTLYVNGFDVDSSRLVAGVDYTADYATKTVTLTESYPAGTKLTLTYGFDETISTDIQAISDSKQDKTYTPSGTGASTRTVESKLQESVSVKDFGAVGDGVTDDREAIQNALVAAEGKTLIFDGSKTYMLSDGVAVYPNTTVEGNGATVIIKAQATKTMLMGWNLSSGCTLQNINGYMTSNGQSVTYYNNYISIGLFYGVGLSPREAYATVIPDIVDVNSAVGDWDAPENVTVKNITCDISALSTTDGYGNSLISMKNFIRNITIENVKAKGFAIYVDKATSDITTGNGVRNDNNLYDAVRFEWGNFVSPAAHASGENITVRNIYGEGLRAHDHSGVVSMGNAHSFHVSNVSGVRTAQIFHCGSSGDATTLDSSVLRTNATNRIVENLVGLDLYTWYDSVAAHYLAGVNVHPSDYTATSAISPFNSLVVRNANFTGVKDTTRTPQYPQYGVIIGDDTWNGDARHIHLSNFHCSKFGSGIHLENCKNVRLTDSTCSFNDLRGLSIASATGYIARNIIVENCYFHDNNLSSYTNYATNSGVGVSIFRGDGITFRDCIFGNEDGTAPDETQLHSVFLRNGQVGFVRFDGCSFVNYESASSFDIQTNSATIQPVVRDCRSVMTTDFVPKVANCRAGFDAKVVASVSWTAAPSTVTVTRSTNIGTPTYNSAGRYTFPFETALPNANYYVLLTGGGAGTPEYFPINYDASQLTTSFQVYVKDATGANVDNANQCQALVVYVDAPDDLNQDII